VTSDLPDPSVVQGAILAGVPIVSDVPDELFDRIERGSLVTVDGTAGSVSFESGEP
jgi:predicted aconitase with swiveling domain